MRLIIAFIFSLYLFFTSDIYAQSQAGGFDDEWANYPAGEFGPANITFDYTNMRLLEATPAAGIHPRLYFNSSDIPDIITRLTTTQSGLEAMVQVHAYTTLLHLGYSNGGTYNHNSSYGSDAFNNRRIDNAGSWDYSELYSKLVAQDATALDGVNNKDRYKLCSIMALEALECMVFAGLTDSDTGLTYANRTNDLATAMDFWATLVIGDPLLDWTNYHYFGGIHMAICYDVHFNSMTTNQQNNVRTALAATIPPQPRYGWDTDYYATTSNWVGLNSFELLTNLAIEGETGYNASLTTEYMRAYRNFLTYGWYQSGTPYEGLGKNYQFVANLIVPAKNGYSLLGHPYLQNYGKQFLPAILQNYGHAFIGTDVWGGTGWDNEIGGYKFNANDIIGLKWMLPNDPTIDFVWRNYIEKYHGNTSTGYVYQQILPASSGYHNYLFTAAVYASDYTPGDYQSQFDANISTEFFAPERGMTVLRSGTESDDMTIHYHCRQDMGGHTHGDRNSFTLSSHGRIWAPYTFGSSFQETQYHSCVLIDDMGIFITQKDGQKARQPGKILNYETSSNSVQICGDATYAYSWEWHWESRPSTQDHSWLGTNNWEEVTETWNDFRYEAGSESYHNLPFYDFGHWNDGGNLERLIKRPYNPMQKVYRTLSLNKFQYPFALIVDDIQKDNDVHNYKWLMQLANDIEVESTDINLDLNNYRNDIILKESSGNRRLLVRVLNNNGQCNDVLNLTSSSPINPLENADVITSSAKIPNGNNVEYEATNCIELHNDFETKNGVDFEAKILPCNDAPGYVETLTPGINGINPIVRLVIEANAIAPNYKILLYPYLDGETLPTTKLEYDKQFLTVTINNEVSQFAFVTTNGYTQIQEYSYTN